MVKNQSNAFEYTDEMDIQLIQNKIYKIRGKRVI